MAVETVHEDGMAGLDEAERGEQEPGQLALLAGIGRPVHGDEAGLGSGEGLAHGLGETGDFLGALLLHAQQHEKGAELFGQDLAGEDHGHRLFRLLDGQRARQIPAAPENGDEAGERMGRLEHGVFSLMVRSILAKAARASRLHQRRGAASDDI